MARKAAINAATTPSAESDVVMPVNTITAERARPDEATMTSAARPSNTITPYPTYNRSRCTRRSVHQASRHAPASNTNEPRGVIDRRAYHPHRLELSLDFT